MKQGPYFLYNIQMITKRKILVYILIMLFSCVWVDTKDKQNNRLTIRGNNYKNLVDYITYMHLSRPIDF